MLGIKYFGVGFLGRKYKRKKLSCSQPFGAQNTKKATPTLPTERTVQVIGSPLALTIATLSPVSATLIPIPRSSIK